MSFVLWLLCPQRRKIGFFIIVQNIGVSPSFLLWIVSKSYNYLVFGSSTPFMVIKSFPRRNRIHGSVWWSRKTCVCRHIRVFLVDILIISWVRWHRMKVQTVISSLVKCKDKRRDLGFPSLSNTDNLRT